MIGLKGKLDTMLIGVKDDGKFTHCSQHLRIENSDPSLMSPELDQESHESHDSK